MPQHYIDAAWFRDRMAAAGKTQAGLAKHLGVDPSAISAMLSGSRAVKVEEIVKIARFMGTSPESVIRALGISIKVPEEIAPRRIPVRGTVSMEGVLTLSEIDDPHRYVELPSVNLDGCIAARVVDGEGPMQILSGATLVFREPTTLDAAAIGRLSVVRTAHGPLTIQKLRPAINVGSYDLVGPAGVERDAHIALASPIIRIIP